MFHLPTDILRLIYEYDDTYKKKYNDVMDQLRNNAINNYFYEENDITKFGIRYIINDKKYFNKKYSLDPEDIGINSYFTNSSDMLYSMPSCLEEQPTYSFNVRFFKIIGDEEKEKHEIYGDNYDIIYYGKIMSKNVYLAFYLN